MQADAFAGHWVTTGGQLVNIRGHSVEMARGGHSVGNALHWVAVPTGQAVTTLGHWVSTGSTGHTVAELGQVVSPNGHSVNLVGQVVTTSGHTVDRLAGQVVGTCGK